MFFRFDFISKFFLQLNFVSRITFASPAFLCATFEKKAAGKWIIIVILNQNHNRKPVRLSAAHLRRILAQYLTPAAGLSRRSQEVAGKVGRPLPTREQLRWSSNEEREGEAADSSDDQPGACPLRARCALDARR